jgi:tRNA-Thr(GGU) m(6)t(6)A37 methyltransferase TsaA
MKIIATIHNGYNTKFGVPRQSNLNDAMVSEIVFEPEYRNEDALRGIENFSHLWLIWKFSETECDSFRPTVRPPRLGGNKRIGVFATRSPYRPNPIGLSSVKLVEVKKTKDKGVVLLVKGADLIDRTPIFDIKPYVKYSDCHPDALCSFADEFANRKLIVEFEKDVLLKSDSEFIELIKSTLENDPKPSYHNDPDRVYTVELESKEIKFKYTEDTIKVIDILY